MTSHWVHYYKSERPWEAVRLESYLIFDMTRFYSILYRLILISSFSSIRIMNKDLYDCIWLLISTWRMTNDEWHSHTDLEIPVTGIWTISVKVCMWLFLLFIICFLSDTQNFLQQNNYENLCSTFKLELSSFQYNNSNQTFKDIFLWNQFKVTSLNFLSVFASVRYIHSLLNRYKWIFSQFMKYLHFFLRANIRF